MRAALEAEADDLGAEELYRAARRDRPGRGRADRAGERPPDDPGARGHRDHRRAVQRLRRGLGASTTRRACASPASGWTAATLDTGFGGRVAAMLEAGWLDEVRALVERGFGAWLTATQAIGYAELAAHLDGRLSLDEAVERDRETDEGARAPPDGVVPARPADPVVRRRRGRRRWRSSTTCGPTWRPRDQAALRSRKYQACGNDFLIVDELDAPVPASSTCRRCATAGSASAPTV